MAHKENEIKYGRYIEEDCCEDCDYVDGSMRMAGCHFPPMPISVCPECGGKLKSVVGRWKYSETKPRWWGDYLIGFGIETTYHGFERGREGQRAKVIHEAQSHINKEVAKWLDECSPYKVGTEIDGDEIWNCWKPSDWFKFIEEIQAETSAPVNLIRWHNIEKDGYPPESGVEYDVYTHDAGYTKVVKVITYDGGNYSPNWLNDNGAEWIFPVTHWRLRPAPPK